MRTVSNLCASIKCKNGGTCINREDSFLCRCPDGFQGAFCEGQYFYDKYFDVL